MDFRWQVHLLTMFDDSIAGESPPNGYDGQFFHDDVDDAADFADVDDGLLGETPGADDEEDLWAGTQELKKAKPETVNYAKRAKRVDVKRLKDNIWKGLKIPARPSKDETETEVRCYGYNDLDIKLSFVFCTIIKDA